jgi:PAS domain S-box-containing protein
VFKNYNKFIKNINTVYKTEERIEQELYCDDGKIFKCIYSLLTYSDYNNECLCIFIDITEEKHIETLLIKNNKSYKSFIKNINAPVIIFDDKYILEANDAFENVFKYSKNEIVGIEYLKFARRFIVKEDVEYTKSIFNTNFKADNNDELYSDGILKFRAIAKDGNILFMESHTTIYYEQDKKYYLVTYKDITEFEKAQEKLKKSEEIYINLLESMPEGIFLESLENGKLIYMNKKLRDILKIDFLDESYIDKGIEDYLRLDEQYKKVVENRYLNLKDGEVVPFTQIKIIDRFNNTLDVEIASTPFDLDNKMWKLTIIRSLEDIKKANFTKKQLLHRIQYDKMKTEFFANISHELKTPLNLIFSSNQLIDMLYKSEKIKEDIDILGRHTKLLRQNGYRLLKLINNVIDVTKMDSGFYKVCLENCNIVDIVENISLSVISYANDKGIELIFDTDVEEIIMAIDPNIIERIVLNLLSNSIKFTNPGGKIYINLYNTEDGVEIEICDSGIGIPQDKLDIIFERFGQVDKTLYRNIEGSGIGLSLVKSLVDLLNGSISVESEYNIGTKFKVKLPIKLIETDKEIQPTFKHNYNVERIHVEFSDIYF